jgi:hypothetical protein
MSESKEEGISAQPARSWLLRINPIRSRRTFPIPEERAESPEHKAGFLSLLTFEWMTHIIFV